MFYNKNFGFTLVETVITIAIISIVLAFSIPHFHEQMAQKESSGLQSSILFAIHTAKNNAASYKSHVVICSSLDGKSCTKAQWNSGFIVFLDTNNSRQADSNERILHYEKTNYKYGTLEWRAALTSPVISFDPEYGLPIGYNGSFIYCSNYAIPSKKIILSKMGHARTEQSSSC